MSNTLVTLAVAASLSALTAHTPAVASPAGSPTASRIAAIQNKGDSDIQARLSSLNQLITSVSSAKRLTADQKSTLTSELQAQVSGLTALQSSLNEETTVASAAADFQNIFKEHYIYAFYLPRTNRIIEADDQQDAAVTLAGIVPKLQAYIAKAQTAGKDVSVLNTQLSDLQTKVGSSQTASQAVITSLLPLQASGYPGNKSDIADAASRLKTSRADLQVARTDAHAIVAALQVDLGSSVVQ